MAHDIKKHSYFIDLKKSLLCLIVLSAVAPMTSQAQSSDQTSAIDLCRQTTDPALRLRCYDSLFAVNTPLPGTQVAPKPTVPDTREIAKENFGTDPKENDLLRPVITPSKNRSVAKVKAPNVTSITEEVTKIDTFGYKKIRVTLANGQVWEQIGSTIRKVPKLSSKRPLVAEIRKAALGSYSLQFDGKGREIKVKRIR